MKAVALKKELQKAAGLELRPSTDVHLREFFTETDFRILWSKYAQKLGDSGQKIAESLLLMNEPRLDGTQVFVTFPNEGSKLDFEKEIPGLLGYLRGHLKNHDIEIDVVVNENAKPKRYITPQDKYNRLVEINPLLDKLRRTFDLELD